MYIYSFYMFIYTERHTRTLTHTKQQAQINAHACTNLHWSKNLIAQCDALEIVHLYQHTQTHTHTYTMNHTHLRSICIRGQQVWNPNTRIKTRLLRGIYIYIHTHTHTCVHTYVRIMGGANSDVSHMYNAYVYIYNNNTFLLHRTPS